MFFNVVRKMAEEDGVKVFYIRGNHDHEMDAATVEQLMGKKVEFIEGTLIYLINSDDGKQYRLRFAHGHDWDLFNTYSLTEPDDPLGGRPIGYYVTRAVATTERVMTETEEVHAYVNLKCDLSKGTFISPLITSKPKASVYRVPWRLYFSI